MEPIRSTTTVFVVTQRAKRVFGGALINVLVAASNGGMFEELKGRWPDTEPAYAHWARDSIDRAWEAYQAALKFDQSKGGPQRYALNGSPTLLRVRRIHMIEVFEVANAEG